MYTVPTLYSDLWRDLSNRTNFDRCLYDAIEALLDQVHKSDSVLLFFKSKTIKTEA